MDCNKCNSKDGEKIPVVAFELEQSRHERREKRFFAVIIILILLLVGTNAAWIYYESQFEDVSITQDVEKKADNGTNNFIGGDLVGTTERKNYG